MTDVYVNNDLSYRNTDTRLATFGVGVSYEDVDDDTKRDTRRDSDVLEQNLKPEDYSKAQSLFGTYWNMFIGGITAVHRAFVRNRAREFNECANGTVPRYWREANRLDDESRRALQKELCILQAQMNTVGGTTRSCFAARIAADAMVDSETKLNAQKLEAYLNAERIQLEGLTQSNAALVRAYIEADQADFDKLNAILGQMKGSWTRNDAAERTRDNIERDITTKRITADYERQAGSVSETAGDYAGDYTDVLAAGQAVAGQFGTIPTAPATPTP